MEKDLTVGKPLPALLKYVTPLFASILFQQMYTVADSLVAGRWVGTVGLAAVGNAYEVTLFLIAFSFGLNIGTSVIVARYFGAKDFDAVSSSVKTVLIFTVVLGAILTALSFALVKPVLRLIQTPDEIFALSEEYLYIYIGGFIFTLFYNVAEGIFSAVGNSGTAFLLLAASSVANVLMDILFVAVFHLGVAGVAWATFICQGLSGTVAIFYAVYRIKKIAPHKGKFSKKILKEILSVSMPSTMQQLFISVGNIVIQGIVNSYGTSVIGGYSAAIKLNNMATTSLVAVGNGVSTFTSQNLGAKKFHRIRYGFWDGILYAGCCALLFTALLLSCKTIFIQFFMSDINSESLRIGSRFLTIVAPFYIIVSIKLSTDGILRGARKMVQFMIATFTDLILRVLSAFLFSAFLGIEYVWWSWPIGWVLGTFFTLLFYRSFIRSLPGKSNQK